MLLVLALFERNVADVALVVFDIWHWSFDLQTGQLLLLQTDFLVVSVLLSVVGQILGEVLVYVESGEDLRLRWDIGHATKHWQYFFQGLSSVDALKNVAKLVMGIPASWHNPIVGASWAASTDGVITGIRSLSDLSPCEHN